jgi:Flp pilus assembly pilin Flp
MRTRSITAASASSTRFARRFLRDERGDEAVNKILIVALICIPIVILIILFKDKIVGIFKTQGSSFQLNPPPPPTSFP